MSTPLRANSSSSSSSDVVVVSGPQPPVHITVNWDENRARLAQRLGVHTNYFDPKFYTMSMDLSLAPLASLVVHFDGGSNRGKQNGKQMSSLLFWLIRRRRHRHLF